MPMYRPFSSNLLPKNTLAVLGTSIENQTTDATGAYYQANGALGVANAILGWPWSSIGDYGVSSDTSGPSGAGVNPGFTSRVASIVSGGYGWCWVGFPINDVANGAGLDPDTFTIPNMQSIYDQLIAAGIVVIAGTGGPTNALDDSGSQVIRNNYAKIQTAIRNYCATHSGIILADTAIAMTDPATGIPLSSPATTVDGIHDNYEGAMRKALAITNVVSSLVKPQNTSTEALFDPRNYVTNCFAQGDNASGAGGYIATTVTGTGPNGWGTNVRNTGAAVGSRASARADYWRQPQQAARLAITATADWDGAWFTFGSDPDVGHGTGRYDQAWVALTAYTYGKRVKPTVANGYHYTLIAPGTTGAAQPTWPTAEGAFVTDGTVVWMCQKTPSVGDQFYAEVEIETSGLTAGKGGAVRLELAVRDTTDTVQNDVYCNYVDLSGTIGKPPRYLPPKMRLRTPTLTLSGGYTLRYLYGTIAGFGEAGASFNLDTFRANIIRVT